jgi:hypothetical protein
MSLPSDRRGRAGALTEHWQRRYYLAAEQPRAGRAGRMHARVAKAVAAHKRLCGRVRRRWRTQSLIGQGGGGGGGGRATHRRGMLEAVSGGGGGSGEVVPMRFDFPHTRDRPRLRYLTRATREARIRYSTLSYLSSLGGGPWIQLCYHPARPLGTLSSWRFMLPSSPTFDLASDASSVLRAAAADAAEARRLAQMARQTGELVLRQAAQARQIDR